MCSRRMFCREVLTLVYSIRNDIIEYCMRNQMKHHEAGSLFHNTKVTMILFDEVMVNDAAYNLGVSCMQ